MASNTSYPPPPSEETETETPTSASPSTEPQASKPSTDTSPTVKKTPLALPAIPTSSDGNMKLDMSNGDTSIKLDHLGPMVVAANGTLSRIANWGEMTEMERRNTLRIIGKRNQERRAKLLEKEGEGEAGKKD
jgi:hypothetical protein